ncbi:MAG: nucleotidyl transferase AbiEii/AbiGii toxin family protein [Planctomycetes bacterium]|nr:nucleotidyl transferase AbiEii/AbiGii toxin family protein [Planctomycetota bacterium]MBI3833880.1 nucleotidyl transferase AbiEii/AbiGii toxin family protein [Planctomycetota bacterium]
MKVLHDGGVRFLVVGGLAVNAHGLLRFTADVDIVIRLVADNVQKAFRSLASLGYLPIVPVTVDGFADAETRKGWIRDKGMRVLQFRSDKHQSVAVDVFIEEPFPFDEEYQNAIQKGMSNGAVVRFVSLDTLIRMKTEAARPRDLADVEELKQVKKNRPNES